MTERSKKKRGLIDSTRLLGGGEGGLDHGRVWRRVRSLLFSFSSVQAMLWMRELYSTHIGSKPGGYSTLEGFPEESTVRGEDFFSFDLSDRYAVMTLVSPCFALKRQMPQRGTHAPLPLIRNARPSLRSSCSPQPSRAGSAHDERGSMEPQVTRLPCKPIQSLVKGKSGSKRLAKRLFRPTAFTAMLILYQSFLMSKDQLNCRKVCLSSSTNLETAS